MRIEGRLTSLSSGVPPDAARHQAATFWGVGFQKILDQSKNSFFFFFCFLS
jgi:hypothetical protein